MHHNVLGFLLILLLSSLDQSSFQQKKHYKWFVRKDNNLKLYYFSYSSEGTPFTLLWVQQVEECLSSRFCASLSAGYVLGLDRVVHG